MLLAIERESFGMRFLQMFWSPRSKVGKLQRGCGRWDYSAMSVGRVMKPAESLKRKLEELTQFAGRMRLDTYKRRARRSRFFGDNRFVLSGEQLEVRLALSANEFGLAAETSTPFDTALLAEGESAAMRLFPFSDSAVSVDDYPTDIASGHFNDDAFIDLVTTSDTEDTVSLLLGNGDGTFQESIPFDVTTGPQALTVADFNGDGLADIAVAGVGGISVLMGVNQGFFAPEVRYGVIDSRTDITIGDFNNDGLLDLLSVGDGLEVFAGNGDGTFEQSSFLGSFGARAVVAADFDGNGNLDAAIVRTVQQSTGGPLETFHEVRVYHGRGNGRFFSTIGVKPERFHVGDNPRDLELVDLDSDGIIDIATADDSGVSLLIGVGDGTFEEVQTLPIEDIDFYNFSGASLDLGDINGDGLLDIVTNGRQGEVAVLLGKASGEFELPLIYQGLSGIGTYPLTVVDVNSDGFSDVALAGLRVGQQGLAVVALANGNGTLQAPYKLLDQYVSSSVRRVFSGVNDDFTGDGKDDLVGYVENQATGSSEIHLRAGGTDRKFGTLVTTVLEPGQAGSAIPIGDVNGDGRADTSGCLGNADGTFQCEAGLSGTPISLDYDGNDLLDFSSNFGILVNQGGSFEFLTYTECDDNDCYETQVAFNSHKLVEKGPLPDFDGDGLSDGVDDAFLYLSDDNDDDDFNVYFDLAPAPQSKNGDVKSGDFNRDGKQDLVYADSTSELSLYLGNGDGTFQSRMAVPSDVSSSLPGLIVDDFNNDAILDIVAYGGGTTLLIGNGDGTFLAPQPLYIINKPFSGDFDGDGWTDLASVDYIYFNVGGGGPRGDETRAARVTEFGGATLSSQVAVKYTLPRDSTAPVTLQFARSDDDVFDTSDLILGTISASPEAITGSSGALQLVGESASDALKEGDHELLIDASVFGFLAGAIADESIPQLFAFADSTHQNALDRDTFAPLRGFHLTAENRAIVRTGPGSKDVMIAKGNLDELTFTFELADTAMPTQSATASTPSEILIVTSSSDDFIHVQHDVTTNTIIRAGDGVNLVVGGAGNDDILGGADTDVLLGEGFDIDVEVFRNFLQNLAARQIELIDLDVAHFGAGQDTIDGGDGFDVIFGGPGDDVLRSGAGGGILFGDGLRLDSTLSFNLQLLIDAADLEAAIEAFPVAFELEAGISLDGSGHDTIYGGSGIELVLAGAGNDMYFALPPEDTESADGGMIDVIFGNDGDDTINDRAARFTVALGGADNDAILGSNSGSFLIGGDGNDTLGGGDGIDVLLGDTLDFGVHSNIDDILSGFGDGKLSAGFAVGPGDENIKGDDVLSGGRGFDFQVGGYGNDYLEGGEGPGLLFGDSFSFAATLNIGFEDAAESDSQSETARRTKSGGWLSKALSLFSVDVDFSLEGTGDDTIIGSTGLDLAFGGRGEDDLFTGGGTVDLLFGNEDNDELRGGGNRTLLTELVETMAADASDLRELGDRIRNKETLRVGGLDDSKFSIMVGGSGSDTLIATPAEDGVPADIGGSVLLGDDFRFLGIPTTYTDIIKLEFNGLIPVFFGIQFGIVQNGIDHEGEGKDILEGAAGGFNLLMGGDGDDTLTGSGFFDILMGDSLNLGADVSIDFRDVSLDKTIEENFDAIDTSFELPGLAGMGADTIRGGDSFTIAIGGDGPDDIRDEGGAVDLLFGNNGDDEIRAGTGFNVIVGGRDTKNALTPPGERRGDFLVGGRDATNVILGDTFQFNVPSLFALNALKNGDISVRFGLAPAGQGDDIIQGGDGLDLIIGGAGDDIITGGDGTNAILGDSLISGPNPFRFSTEFFQAAINALFGDPNGALDNATNALGLTDTGDDRIFGGNDTDIVFGGNGNDKIFGRDGFDFLVGGGGDDEVFGERGRDIVFGGLGADELHGGEDDDHLESEEGADAFFGEEGNDRIFGGIESDFLFGGPGDDELYGEAGDDLLDGGTGNNTFNDDEGTNTIVERLAADDNAFTTSGVAVTLDVLTNDGNGIDSILLDDFTQPVNGSVSRDDRGTPDDTSDDRLVFTPADDFIGDTSFEYEVRTLGGETDTASIKVAVDGVSMDYGDAPEVFGFPTSFASNGARHALGSLTLGALIDAESNALLDDAASGFTHLLSVGDDVTGADEDGVAFITSVVATSVSATRSSVAVVASSDGKLDAWIDFDQDGTWSHDEQVFTSQTVVGGMNLLSFEVPSSAAPGATHARFRLSSMGGLQPTGPAADGEVEDYTFTVVDGNAALGATVVSHLPAPGAIDVVPLGDELVLQAGATELLRVPMAVLDRVEVFGTDGDDVLNIVDTGVFEAGLVSGDSGPGYDTLRLTGSGQTFDLTQVADSDIQGFEAIDLTGSGNNSLTLDVDEVRNLSSTTDVLRIHHNEDDVVSYGEGWIVQVPQVIEGQYFHLLSQDNATIHVANTLAYRNPFLSLDTNHDGGVSPVDALVIINRLNTTGPEELLTPTSVAGLTEFFYIDTNGDHFVAPVDVIQIVNFLNSPARNMEGESPVYGIEVVALDTAAHKSDVPLATRIGDFPALPDLVVRTIGPPVAVTSSRSESPGYREALDSETDDEGLMRRVDALFVECEFRTL